MDARLVRACLFCTLTLISSSVFGASHATENFVAQAPTEEIARRVAECAEFWRRDLAMQWLGQPLPTWSKPCPIQVKVGQIGAGGATTFTFDHGEVFGWNMEVQGTLERILDSVVPHEVNHTIFASYFRRPVPRWADEGAATLFEHESEQRRQVLLLDEVLETSRRIPLSKLLQIREYPSDMRDVLTLYAEGYALTHYLVSMKGDQGRQVFLKFLKDAHQQGWERAFQAHYGYGSIKELETEWKGWVVAGWPSLSTDPATLAAGEAPQQSQPRQEQQLAAMDAVPDLVVRSQSPQPKELVPLPMFDRTLRVPNARDDGRLTVNDASLRRTVEAPAPYASQQDVNSGRSRWSGQSEVSPSLLSPNLSPTADGIPSNSDAGHYQFPASRR
ncbi:MAG: hypothetical protein KDA80_05925 [Planctomycetaceae bacterium]|nr:hypothetical protein [Planctomycetaceae bacterium]